MMCERHRQTKTEGDEWRLPHWPITSSLGHTTLCYLQGPLWHFSAEVEESTRSPLCALDQSGVSSHSLALSATDHISFLPKRETNRLRLTLSVSHMGICIYHNTQTFPFNHVTASAFFHRCVLCRESLIDGSDKGQYATLDGNIW